MCADRTSTPASRLQQQAGPTLPPLSSVRNAVRASCRRALQPRAPEECMCVCFVPLSL